jgi:hypothetical protein
MTVLDYGRMAVLADPTGAAFGIWQAGTNVGFGIQRETGAIAWSELNTRDPGTARSFYGPVFGWAFEEREFEGAGTYTTISAGEDAFGGVLDITGRVANEVPAHWLVYFAVDDAESTAEEADQAGGEVLFGPEKMKEVGTLAVIKDPFGAVFAVIQPDPEMATS